MVATTARTPGRGLFGRTTGLFPVAFGIGVVVATFAVAFLSSIQWVIEEWSGSSGVLSHGYLVAAISIYLLVRAVPDVAALPTKPFYWALPFVFGLSLIWLLGHVSTVVAVQTMVLPAILLTTIAAAFGLAVARRLAFPILFVYFAVPAWDHLQFVFQAITVAAVSILIRVIDIPALVVGNFVHLPLGTFEIAGGCSGLNFIVAGLSLAVLYSHLFYTKAKQAISLIMLVLLVAMIGNWIRVFTIIMIGYHSDMQSTLVTDHLTMGWILFAALMVPVAFVAHKIEIHDDVGSREVGSCSSPSRNCIGWLGVSAAIVTMLIPPVWAATVASSSEELRDRIIALPDGQGRWNGPVTSAWEWRPEFAEPSVERMAQYGNDTFVLVYTNYYPSQAQGRELVYFSNSISGDWDIRRAAQYLVTVALAGSKQTFRQVVATNYAGDWLIWYRYEVGNRVEVSEMRAKVAQAFESLRGNTEAGVVAFAARCTSTCDEASSVLREFVSDIGHTIHVELGTVK